MTDIIYNNFVLEKTEDHYKDIFIAFITLPEDIYNCK